MKYLVPAALIAAAFVFWHTGARASALCVREVFVSGGSLSLWPPGARCGYGLPVRYDTFVNGWFLFTAFALVAVAVLADTIRATPSRRTG